MFSHVRRLIVLLGVSTASIAAGVIAPNASAVVPTQLSLTPQTQIVKWHATARLVAHLRDAVGPMSGVAVSVWQRAGAGAWQRAANTTTNNDGAVAVAVRLRRSTEWQVRYAGDLAHNASASPVARVTVLPPPRPRHHASLAFGRRVVREAARHRGAPYQYGAAGPQRFDCSGFTMYVFGRFHISLPHNAQAQWDHARHVRSGQKQLGDLIFFYSGSGGIYHVGIYAGHGRMWAATHTGDVVRLESIYAAPYLVGRVR